MSPGVFLQYVAPHRLLSRLAYFAAHWRWAPWKNAFIGQILKRFDVNMDEAENPDAFSHPSFNAFFTRALKPGARIADPDPRAQVMPSDGRISQLGRIEDGRILQAKGQSFTAAELLGDASAAAAFEGGNFANIYLAPRDYHRVHMPWAGTLRETLHIPGRLFSVAPWAVRGIPRLFARNERLVCHFDTDIGPMAVVMVGAMLVSGVETVWSGIEIPKYASRPVRKDWRGKGIELARFAEMARFNYGSTVVVLWPHGAVELDPALGPEQSVKVGQRLGTTVGAAARS
ncbi:archaetidylserine decarboxylase [Chiayiivirga flava]|uniref:Phosphatidylserine decarboxylase proenzyme n=1 Tax=Chiayiivirga flava TaxID=659595 RepID=A0A7W8D2B6_9GAMM|nr:archaetidylserine decarboxylase [Chiayiivirga flava]MBB5206680.1 phosphatidylserine decarboxylase [Chiayiivirga flava]